MRIEYAIDFIKNNGGGARKVFSVSESTCAVREKVILKRHSFKIITTRKYYAGIHRITAIINGHELANKGFQLVERA